MPSAQHSDLRKTKLVLHRLSSVGAASFFDAFREHCQLTLWIRQSWHTNDSCAA